MLALIAALLAIALPSHAQEPVEAKEAFDRRQQDLVTLAGHFGTLHRLHQLCGNAYSPDLFRNRMREFVPLESPMGRTRLDMIAAFNAGYRETSAIHTVCGDEAQSAYEAEGERALAVTDRLYAPFR